MTSMQRVLTTLRCEEPDRVPFFLFLGLHGAKLLGMSLREYFSKPEYVVEGQLKLRERYHYDCVTGFYYAPVEIEPWGGQVIFFDDGPPNSGMPPLTGSDDIYGLQPPDIDRSPIIQEVLRAIRMLKDEVGDEAPVIGVAISPFSLPVLQLGFDRYIELIYEQPDQFKALMSINEEFCVAWANAQLNAGATFVAYFDPISSTSVIPRDLYVHTGLLVAKRTIPRFKGLASMHFASGRCLGIMDSIIDTGVIAVGVSEQEDLAELKAAAHGKVALLGNLNAVEMRRWTPEQAKAAVKAAIAKAGPGGGFILADNHGEIPWLVPDYVIQAISDAVLDWGNYPLEWV